MADERHQDEEFCWWQDSAYILHNWLRVHDALRCRMTMSTAQVHLLKVRTSSQISGTGI